MSSAQMMRAVVITRPGDPSVLELRDVPIPKPRDGEVLVRIHATALNRADLLQRQGKYPAPPDVPADIPGLELAGEVVDRGPHATRWTTGARVFGIVGGGGHAEFMTVHENALAQIPASMSWTEAAAVPEAFITAHDALITQAMLRAGESVLIHAVASGVGLAAVQLARAWGASPFGTTRSESKLARLGSIGLSDCLLLDDDLSKLGDAVKRWTTGRGIDVTMDLVGGAYFVASVHAAAQRGRIVLIGTMGGASAEVPLGLVLRKRLTIRGTVLRSRSLAEKIDATERFAREVVPLFETGQLKPVIDCIMPLSEIAEAHRRMGANATEGKIVLEVG